MLQSLCSGNQVTDRVATDNEISQLIRADLEFFVDRKNQRNHGHRIRAQVTHKIQVASNLARDPCPEMWYSEARESGLSTDSFFILLLPAARDVGYHM